MFSYRESQKHETLKTTWGVLTYILKGIKGIFNQNKYAQN